ncbi:hypothetical protein RA989_21325, partial [Mycobacteroides abscessus subsp. massiliense]
VALAGEVQEAQELVSTISDPFSKAEALSEVAKALAADGEFDEAERIARTVANPDLQGIAFLVLAREVSASGDFDRAARLVESISGPRTVLLLRESAGDRYLPIW